MAEKYKQARIISNKIKELRVEAGWNQSELARRVDITRAALSQIEKGERVPSLFVARKIAYTLGISLEDLINEQEKVIVNQDIEKIFWRKFKRINDLSSEDQKKIEDYITLIADARASKEGK